MKHNPKVEILIDSDKMPFVSIVVPVHNQEEIISKVITSIFTKTKQLFELIIIFDGCTDLSRENAINSIVKSQNLCRVTLLTNQNGIFETSCDNQGFMISRSEFIIEIQADMIIEEEDYDVLLCRPLIQYTDIIAVSGRCCHQVIDDTKGIGKLGMLVQQPHKIKDKSKLFLSQTCNRGPLILRKSMLVALNYLDEEHYALGDDEHDLFARAWVQKKWRTGFFPIEYQSRIEWGSTRKSRPAHVQQYLNMRLRNISDGFLNKNKHSILFPQDEIRELT